MHKGGLWSPGQARLMLFWGMVVGGLWNAGALFAGQVRVSVDPQRGSLGDTFSLAITVEGELDSPIRPPEIAGLDWSEAGKSSNYTIINGRMRATAIYYYHLSPARAGQYTVPSFGVRVDGETIATRAVSFAVAAAGNQIGAARDELPLAFVERTVSKTNPYEGEPVISTVKIYARIELSNLTRVDKPSADFRYEEIGQASGRTELSGALYDIITYKEVMIPQKAGSRDLPPYELEAHMVVPTERSRQYGGDLFGEFFGRAFGKLVKKRLASQPIKLDVRPVPQDGRPPRYQGLVGEFKLASELSASTLKQGETATLSVKIEGAGLLDPLGQSLPIDLDGKVKVYPDKPEIQSKTSEDSGITASRIYRYALVPTKAGTIELGRLSIPVFNPRTERFEVLTSQLGQLSVEAVQEERVVIAGDSAGGPAHRTPAQKNVKALAQDLIDVHRSFDASERHELDRRALLWFWILFALPLALYLGLWTVHRLRLRRGGDSSERRRSLAYRRYKAEKEKLLAQAKAQELDAEVLTAYYRVYRDYLGDKFRAHGGALTPREIDRKLVDAGANGPYREQAKAVAEAIDRLAFGGQEVGPEVCRELLTAMDRVVLAIEKRGS